MSETVTLAGPHWPNVLRAAEVTIVRRARAEDVDELREDLRRHGHCLIDAGGARVDPADPHRARVRIEFHARSRLI